MAAAKPVGDGFYLPEESAPHERTFMQWPVSRAVYRERWFLEAAQQTIADLANTIADFEPVTMLMAPDHEAAARRLLGDRIEIWDIPTEDLWCRDSGPQFVVDGEGWLAVCQLNFNGWGGRQVHEHDGRIAERVARRLGVPLLESGLAGEGGGVEADGDGTLIAHESSWVHPNRNAESREVIGARLTAALGAERIVWAPGVRDADITDYHIDSLARFVRPGVIAIQMPEAIDPRDPWSKAAFATYDILAGATDARGRNFELVHLPEPIEIRENDPDFVAAYPNYYVCNGAVIMAAFGDALADAEAVATMRSLYPGREIVTVNADILGLVGGGVHCAAREMPALG